MTFDLADFRGAALSKWQHLQDDITLTNGLTVIPDGISTVPLLFYVNGHTEKISLSGIRYCSKLDTKLISHDMLDRKRLAYSSQHGILSVRDSSFTIMVGRLTPHNLYKVEISEAPGKVSATPALSTGIDFSRTMTAGTSKSAADLFTWHRRLAHLNETSVKQLFIMVPGMEIVASKNRSFLYSVCIKVRMIQQPHRDARPHSSQPGFRLHADVGKGGQTYITFRGYCYFLLFVYEATSYV